jgi:branched-chain amino acid transport system substrate-binding protein
MLSRSITSAIASLALSLLATSSAYAQDTIKIGILVAMTGEQASTGKHLTAGVDLYTREYGDTTTILIRGEDSDRS